MDCAQVMELGFLFESDFLIACKYDAREMATGLDESVYTAAEEAWEEKMHSTYKLWHFNF